MPENHEAWEIFTLMTSQVRTAGMGGTITGVDFNSFKALCEIRGVPQYEREFLLDKVMEVVRIGMSYWNKSSED